MRVAFLHLQSRFGLVCGHSGISRLCNYERNRRLEVFSLLNPWSVQGADIVLGPDHPLFDLETKSGHLVEWLSFFDQEDSALSHIQPGYHFV